MKKAIVIGILLLLVVPVVMADNDIFAQCLTEKGMRMYGMDWCPYCQNQKALFGDSFRFIDYTNCELNMEECVSIVIYPTWMMGGRQYSGYLTLEQLSRLTGCELIETWQETGCKFIPVQHCYGRPSRMRCYEVMQRQCGTFECHNEYEEYTLEYPDRWVWNQGGYWELITLYETKTTTKQVCELI